MLLLFRNSLNTLLLSLLPLQILRRRRLRSLLFGSSLSGSGPRLLGGPPFRPLLFLQLLYMPLCNSRGKAREEEDPRPLDPPDLVHQPVPVCDPPLRDQACCYMGRVRLGAILTVLIDTPFLLVLLLLLLLLLWPVGVRKRDQPFQMFPNWLEGVVDHAVEYSRIDSEDDEECKRQ